MQIPPALSTAIQFAFHTVAAKILGMSSTANQFLDRITGGQVNQKMFIERAAHYAIKLDLEFPYLAKRLGVRPSEIIMTVCSGDRARILNTAGTLLHAGAHELLGERLDDATGIFAEMFPKEAAHRA
ncbi:MAG: hypothetical protein ACRYGL_14800 [Janthinobacterium lividum]